MPAKTTYPFTERSAFLNHLNDIREQKYALDNEETIEGLYCVAMPVTDADSKIFGAVRFSGPPSWMTNDWVDQELVKDARPRDEGHRDQRQVRVTVLDTGTKRHGRKPRLATVL